MDEKKKLTERIQMRNLLASIRIEYGDFFLLEDSERPDFTLTIPSGHKIGIEITQCCPSNEKTHGCKLKLYKYKEAICKQFLKNEVLSSFTQSHGMNIIIYPTSVIYNKRHRIDDFCKEIEQHLITVMATGKDLPTQLIRKIRIIHRSGSTNIIQFNHISRRDAVKAQDLLNVIKTKEVKAKGYNLYNENWLCIYLPWQENLHPYTIDYETITQEVFNNELSNSCFTRIYVSSELDIDFLRLK